MIFEIYMGKGGQYSISEWLHVIARIGVKLISVAISLSTVSVLSPNREWFPWKQKLDKRGNDRYST